MTKEEQILLEKLEWPTDEDCKNYPKDIIVMKKMWDKINEIIDVVISKQKNQS